jgi:T5SS/PEP-CTERM-associated repeat protein
VGPNAGVFLAQGSPFTQGTVNVSGAGTMWTTGDLRIEAGTGTLSITGGANVVSNEVYMGLTNDDLASTALVSGAGSTWTATFMNLGNGFAHHNVLEVQTGGLVNLAQDLRISENCKVILNGGTIHFDTYTNDGTFEFNYGTVALAGGNRR